jgi:REP element-mobilizing transposase RayT
MSTDTYQGAYHHGMNLGYEGKAIFAKNNENETLLNLLKEISEIRHIRIFTYCLMDNHYHLVWYWRIAQVKVSERRRIDKYYFNPVEKVFQELKNM